jgi:hypothetical protein
LKEQAPVWHPWEAFLFASVPNHDKSGCYALFEGPEFVYVGLGASKGGGIYVEHGLSRRLMAHVLCADKLKGPDWSKLQPEWASITGVYTIGLPVEVAYLATSLEAFLIRNVQPPRNKRV